MKINLDDILYASLTVAYCLSGLNTRAVVELGYKTHSQAFTGIGKILGQKATTIKNMRDEFDTYFDNGRRGWYQREMSVSRKEVYNCFKDVSDDEVLSITRQIINKKKGKETKVKTMDDMNKKKENNTVKYKIKLSSPGVKEIRVRNRNK